MPRKYNISQTPAERFWSKVLFTDTCWLWTGAITSGGYGNFYDGAGNRPAHCWAYEFCVGPIPDGHEIDHLCRVHPCVYPDHLEAVTPVVNKRRSLSPIPAKRLWTHCLRGHEFAPANTYIKPNSTRRCRACARISDRKRRARERWDGGELVKQVLRV